VADLSLRLVPNELWALVEPLILGFTTRPLGTPPQRIEQLVELITHGARGEGGTTPALLSPATQSGIAAIQHHPSQLDHDVIDRLHESVRTINGQIGGTPFVRLQLQLMPSVEFCRRLLALDQVALRQELIVVASAAYSVREWFARERRRGGAV